MMNTEKQIDEMAKDLCHTETCEIKKIGITCNHRCKAHIYATRAIAKGDRKASEVAREIFEEIEKIAMHNVTSSHGIWLLSMGEVAFAELKKKYTEDGNENNVNANGL